MHRYEQARYECGHQIDTDHLQGSPGRTGERGKLFEGVVYGVNVFVEGGGVEPPMSPVEVDVRNCEIDEKAQNKPNIA